MKTRAFTFVVVMSLICAGVPPAFSSSQQDAPPAQTPSHDQGSSSQSAPSQSSPEQTSPNTQPGPSVAPPQAPSKAKPSGEHATPPPKPPVLRHKKHVSKKANGSTTRKSAPASGQPSGSQPSKVVVRNGGAKDESAQLAPAVTPDQAQHERASTDQLLAVTDANLKQVSSRQLTSDQQSTLDQIHTYMRQAKVASAAGDTNRAQTLANKARLLSDELARK